MNSLLKHCYTNYEQVSKHNSKEISQNIEEKNYICFTPQITFSLLVGIVCLYSFILKVREIDAEIKTEFEV